MSRERVAIIGFGFMGGMHAQIYEQLPNAELSAVVDVNPDRARTKLKELGFDCPVFSALDDLLAAAEVDVIDICGPTDQHVALSAKAAAAGKHLFIEKPLALTMDGCQEIASAIESNGVLAQVGHCIRFWPEYVALKEFVDRGEAGALKSLSMFRRAARPAYSQRNWLNDNARSGGAAMDLHVHDTDFVLHLLGLPKSVYSAATQGMSGPDHIFTNYAFDGQAICAEGGWDYPEKFGFRMAFEAVFDNACVSFDSSADPTLMLTLDGREPEAMPFEQPGAGESTAGEGNVSSLGGYYNELAYFINCVAAGRAPEVATVAQAGETIRVVLAEIESANTGAPAAL